MRLKQIKLSGFKSFVDPTAFDVPSQLVGVVGPNGCGKSNIMDAVRWVLGESKASELRGESMQDVIFNGSAERRPAGRASVELVFDNSLGRIGGNWGRFAEISVRRVLTRDGNSTYLINNQAVRRRDVHDVFLGTGLGPRAYAIIGQGMISRLIEARPEELRIYLEEAAGVSKYKERRRETSNRLAATRENLARLEDIRGELGQRIEHLVQQAERAERFRALERERERKQHMYWLVRRDEAQREQQRCAQREAAARHALEAKITEQRALEAEIERHRAAHEAAAGHMHGEQARFYEANAAVARLETEIRHVEASSAQLGERLAALELAADGFAAELHRAHEGANAAREAGEEAEARGALLEDSLDELAAALPRLEADVRAARAALEREQLAVAEVRRARELCLFEERNAGEQLARLAQRRERLDREAAALQEVDPGALEAARHALVELEARADTLATQLEQARNDWQEHDARRAPAWEAARKSAAVLTQTEARIAALRELEERAESQARVVPWLKRHAFAGFERLWKHLRIEDGWELAIESVLRERVEALQLPGFERLVELLDTGDAPPAKVAFFAAIAAAPGTRPAAPGAFQGLAERVRVADPAAQAVLDDWLAACYQAPDLAWAIARRDQLPPGGRFVVRAGHQVGRTSVGLHASDNQQDGLLVRRHELDNLERAARAARMLSEQERAAAEAADTAVATRSRVLEAARKAHEDCGRELAAARVAFERLAQQARHSAEARARIRVEEDESEQLRASLDEARAQAQARLHDQDALLGEHEDAAAACRESLLQAEAAHDAHRARLGELERNVQELRFAARTAAAEVQRCNEIVARTQQSAQRDAAEAADLRERRSGLSAETARAALQAALEAQRASEQALLQARERHEGLGAQLRGAEQARLRAEREQEPLRAEVGRLQLAEQAARIGVEQFAEQLEEARVDATQLRNAFGTEVPKASWLQGEVTRLGNALAALGAVNLAALDELAEARERAGFLDAQSSDLVAAIETLEDAIRKIDRETRQLLQSTYDTVNRHFGTLFPQLFGGGEARLVLSGDEILDAGVQVVAQPPGKRNSSIHQLSGGEKALTAIALVFALFQLNPAPFCLLDEVDAPLDERNTERYVEIVRRMSDQTQFLFITHNKVAMELATHLIGVTMQERGVSRIVAVDLDHASEYAEVA